MKKWLLWLGIAASLIAGASYQWTKIAETRSREQLLQRVNEYWEAMRLNDLHTVYRLEAAAAEGKLRPDEAYRGNPDGIRILHHENEVVEINGNFATVKVNTKITFPELDGKEITGGVTNESWVRIKGDWYHDTPDKKEP